MAWLARRTMTLIGDEYKSGERVPDDVIDQIDPQRLQVMRRVGVILEATPAQIAEITTRTIAPKGEGEMCETCGGGPYKQLSQHVTKMHTPEPAADTEEES